jgi:hypothetical protein
VNGAALLAELAHRGFWIERRENDLYVTPRRELTNADRDRIRAFKTDILTEIRRTEAEQALKDTLAAIGQLRIHPTNRARAGELMALFGGMLDELLARRDQQAIHYCLLDFRRNLEALTKVSFPTRGLPVRVSQHVVLVADGTDQFGLCEICRQPAALVLQGGHRFCRIECYRTVMPEAVQRRKKAKSTAAPCPLCGGRWLSGQRQAFSEGSACAGSGAEDLSFCRKYEFLRRPLDAEDLTRPPAKAGPYCLWPQT